MSARIGIQMAVDVGQEQQTMQAICLEVFELLMAFCRSFNCFLSLHRCITKIESTPHGGSQLDYELIGLLLYCLD